MTPLPSAAMTLVMILCGAIAVVVMMNRLGRPDSQPTLLQINIHRVSGWIFVASFLALFGTMVIRFYYFWEEDPARIVLHYAAAFVLFLLLLLKISIPRFYPGFRKHLFAIGFSVFTLAFLTAASALSHYIVRTTLRAPYISHTTLSDEPNLALG